MVCLMSKINECYDILNFAGLTPEQAGAINIDSLTDDQLVDITCELYGGLFDFLGILMHKNGIGCSLF